MNIQLLKEYAKSSKSEHELQCYCVDWFRNKYPEIMIFAIPNGGKRPKKINKYGKKYSSESNKLKKEGVLKGIPDLFVAKSSVFSSGLFIEMKYAKNKLTDEQKEVHKYLQKAGYTVNVCYSLEQFIEAVETYLNNNKNLF